MKLTKIAGNCGADDDCPAVYVTDRETVIIQGDLIVHSDVRTAEHEALVEIPLTTFREACDAAQS